MTLITTDRPIVTLHNIDWAEYCKLRDDESHKHIRMMYLDGELTIMSPSLPHDNFARRMYEIVRTVALAWDINYFPIGTTTLRREGRAPVKGSGKEPDEAFYLGDDEASVGNNKTLDLTVDPPPSLAIEVENWSEAEAGLAAYARIGVPEVWLYKAREHTLWFGRLNGDTYESIDRSLGLPRLTPALVLQALDKRIEGMRHSPWVRWLEGWARALPEPPAA